MNLDIKRIGLMMHNIQCKARAEAKNKKTLLLYIKKKKQNKKGQVMENKTNLFSMCCAYIFFGILPAVVILYCFIA